MLIKAILAFVSIFVTSDIYAAEGVSTMQILGKSFQAISKCSHYKVKGICHWVDWKKSGFLGIPTPHYSTSLYVEHYLPDLVVSVYPEEDKFPWKDMRSINKIENTLAKKYISKLIGSIITGGQIETQYSDGNNIRFKEVSIIGHPQSSLPFPGVLPSQTSALHPYYNSYRDAAFWRFPENPAGIISGLNMFKSVGKGHLNEWGPLYPRTGFVNQNDDAKSAAVLAIRALNIITTNNFNLSKNITNNSCGIHCQGPGEISDESDTYFQMIYPIKEKTCSKLVNCDSGYEDPKWVKESRQDNGTYVWVVWRKYEGCGDMPGKRIGCTKW